MIGETLKNCTKIKVGRCLMNIQLNTHLNNLLFYLGQKAQPNVVSHFQQRLNSPIRLFFVSYGPHGFPRAFFPSPSPLSILGPNQTGARIRNQPNGPLSCVLRAHQSSTDHGEEAIAPAGRQTLRTTLRCSSSSHRGTMAPGIPLRRR